MNKNTYAQARANMVAGQLRPNRITNLAVLHAMAHTPREVFTTEPSLAYADSTAPMGGARSILPPLVLATMVQALDLQQGASVLVVADGTGAGAATVAEALSYLGGGTVTATEPDNTLAQKSHQNLKPWGVACRQVDWSTPPAEGPFDAILVTTPVGAVPEGLTKSLKNGGKLAALTKAKTVGTECILQTRNGQTTFQTTLAEVDLPIPPGFEPKPTFVF